jgi:hypothetical protein
MAYQYVWGFYQQRSEKKKSTKYKAVKARFYRERLRQNPQLYSEYLQREREQQKRHRVMKREKKLAARNLISKS